MVKFHSPSCPECARATIGDIVFLVDGSSSIGTTNFQEVRLFLRNFASGLDIGPDKIRIGLAQYSNDPHQEFLLKDHMEKTALLAALDSFPYRTGGTETGKAIDFLRTQYFTKEAGSRANQRVPQIAVVITDGDSTDDVIVPAQNLRKHGVIVFAIGVGNANQNELESIANRPPKRFKFTIDSFQALQRLTNGLLQTMCVSMEDRYQGKTKIWVTAFLIKVQVIRLVWFGLCCVGVDHAGLCVALLVTQKWCIAERETVRDNCHEEPPCCV